MSPLAPDRAPVAPDAGAAAAPPVEAAAQPPTAVARAPAAPPARGTALSHPTAAAHRRAHLLRLQRTRGNGFVGGMLGDAPAVRRVVGDGEIHVGTPDAPEERRAGAVAAGNAALAPTDGRGDVRLHDDAAADAAATELGAEAFTSGRDVYFRSGRLRTDTAEGRSLLAHELTHAAEAHAEDTVRRQEDPTAAEQETAEQRVRRIIADGDEGPAMALAERATPEDGAALDATTPEQRGGLIRILVDLTWTRERAERSILVFVRLRGEQRRVLAFLDSIGYGQRLLDAVDDDALHAELEGYLADVTPAAGAPGVAATPAVDAALSSGESSDVMAIRIDELARATTAQRLGLLRILIEMSWSNEDEESKMVEILESAGVGTQLRELVSQLTAAGLKQRLFDHIDSEGPRQRLTTLLSNLRDPEIDEDLRVLNQGFWAGVGETLSRGWEIATREFSISRMVMGLWQMIRHPLDTIGGLLDQLEGIFQNPSLYRVVTFLRDYFGFVGLWVGILALLVTGVAAAAAAGIITIPAAIPIAAIALVLNLVALALGIIFIVLAVLRFVLDVIEGGAATTAAERRRAARRTGEDIEGFFGLAIFIAIVLLLKALVRAIRAPAVEESAATPEGLQETASEAQAQQGEISSQASEAQSQAQAAEGETGATAPRETPPTATGETPPATTEPPTPETVPEEARVEPPREEGAPRPEERGPTEVPPGVELEQLADSLERRLEPLESHPDAPRMADALDFARTLLDEGRIAEARELLQELERRVARAELTIEEGGLERPFEIGEVPGDRVVEYNPVEDPPPLNLDETAPGPVDATGQRLLAHVAAAVAEFESRMPLTERQLAALQQHPELYDAFRGSQIDALAKESVLNDPALEHVNVTRNFEYGADFYDSHTGRWYDITTTDAWKAHVRQYGGSQPGRTPVPGSRLPTEPR